MIHCKTMAEQRTYFDTVIAPIFDKRLVRWATSKKMSLYGLGIPPAQYEALAGGGDMSVVLRARLEKLACDHPMGENYFAWQAFRAAMPAASPAPCRPICATSISTRSATTPTG